MKYTIIFIALCLQIFILLTKSSKQPNIVFLYTDDQDVELGSMEAIPKIQNKLFNEGATFDNFFVTTPICCASRTSLLSGRYQHNINGESNWW